MSCLLYAHGLWIHRILLLKHVDIDVSIKDPEGNTAVDVYNTTVQNSKPHSTTHEIFVDLLTWGTNLFNLAIQLLKPIFLGQKSRLVCGSKESVIEVPKKSNRPTPLDVLNGLHKLPPSSNSAPYCALTVMLHFLPAEVALWALDIFPFSPSTLPLGYHMHGMICSARTRMLYIGIQPSTTSL